MFKTKLDELKGLLKGLVKLLNPDEVYKLKQYTWWSTYNFIESIELDYEIESDDEGGSYKSYWIAGLKLNNSEKFIDFLIKEQGADLINDLFGTKYVNYIDTTADKSHLYELAKDILSNENKYDLIDLLENKIEEGIFYEQNDFKITKNPGSQQIENFINSFIRELKIIVDKYDS